MDNRVRLLLTRFFAAVRGLLYASGFVLLWGWVVSLARPFDSRLAFVLPDWLRAPGFVVAACGIALVLGCVVVFGLAGGGTPVPFDPPREFVAVGPYRYVRNPMYLGAVGVIVGCGLVIRSPSALGVAAVFITLAHLFVMLYEEPDLERRFGESYLQYRRSVNRWIPRRLASRARR